MLRDFGIPVEVRKLYAGDEVPTDPDEIRLLVMLGGPARLPDDIEADPILSAELALMKTRVERDQPVLGICLGAQMLALAAGAKVYPNAKPAATPDGVATPMPELGWKPINLPFPGGTDPLVMGVRDGAMMFHWHYDTFDLPKLNHANPPKPPAPPPPTGNVLMCSTPACRNQAFRFKTALVGYQFHFEFLPADIEAILANATDSDKAAIGPGGIEQIREQTKALYSTYERLGNRMLRNFVQFMKLY